jgi:hypothetical protein
LAAANPVAVFRRGRLFCAPLVAIVPADSGAPRQTARWLLGGVAMVGRRALLGLFLAGLAPNFVARAATRLPDYPGPPADQQISVSDDGVSLATYLMADPHQQATYFGGELDSRGIVPLWLSVSNSAADRTFLVDASEIAVVAADTQAAERKRADKVAHADADLTTGQVAAAFGFYGLPLVFIADAALVEANEMKRSLIEKAFYSHTLHPGQSATGFIFLRTAKPHQTFAGMALVVVLHPAPAQPGSPAKTYHLNLVAPQPA